MSHDIQDLRRRISKAKLTLMQRPGTTFFSALLSGFRYEITESTKTASIDGITMRFNPGFIEPLTHPQLIGLMMHEAGHVVYKHLTRRKAMKLNPKLWNIAGDHYINLWLLSLGFELPENGYWDSKYRGWSTMKIYKDLLANPPPNSDDFDMDIIGRPADMDETTHEETINGHILKAATQARLKGDPGSIPGSVERHIKAIVEPKIPWQVILQNHLTAMRNEDYSWSRPNRRYMASGIYLPHRFSEGLGLVTDGVDVSASMTQEDLDAIYAELKFIWETMKPEKMRIQTFDTRVHMDKMFNEGDSLDKLVLKGGGGTNVGPLIEVIRKEQPEFALIFTDGFFSTPDMTNITSEIFWIIKGNKGFKNPVGTIIHFD